MRIITLAVTDDNQQYYGFEILMSDQLMFAEATYALKQWSEQARVNLDRGLQAGELKPIAEAPEELREYVNGTH